MIPGEAKDLPVGLLLTTTGLMADCYINIIIFPSVFPLDPFSPVFYNVP
jgi:hypothetical protein